MTSNDVASTAESATELQPALNKFNCPHCGKHFKGGQGLDYHTDHFVCQKLTCRFCQHRFKSSSGLKYHLENRICLPKEKIKIVPRAKHIYRAYTVPREKVNLECVVASVKNFAEELFGSQNIIVKFTEMALCNEKLTEYWSCYITNKREPYVAVYCELPETPAKWVLRPQTAEFVAIIEWAQNMIESYLKSDPTTDKKYWSKYLLARDQLTQEKNSIHRDTKQGLYCLFVNIKKDIQLKSLAIGQTLRP